MRAGTALVAAGCSTANDPAAVATASSEAALAAPSEATAATAPAIDDVAVEVKGLPTMDIMSRPVNYAGSGDTVSEAPPPRHTDVTRPAPAAMAHQVIYNATVRRHQVSTGTKRVSLTSNAPVEAARSVTLASRPREGSMPGDYVWVSDLDGGTCQRSSGSNWVCVDRDCIWAMESLLGVLIAGKPLAGPVPAYTASRKVYVDPGAAPGGDGSRTSPRNSLAGVSLSPGTEVLIRQGATL